MVGHNRQRLILGGTVLMFGTILTLFIVLLVQFLDDRSNRVTDAKNIAQTMALGAASAIEEQVSSLEVAGRIAEEFTATLVPDAPATIESWRSYFFQVRRRFFFTGIFLFACFIANTLLLLDLPLVHPQRIGQGAAITMLLIGAVSENPRVHAALVFLALGVFALMIAIFFLRPGGFADA